MSTLPSWTTTTPTPIDTRYFNYTWNNTTNMINGTGNISQLVGAVGQPIVDLTGTLGIGLILASFIIVLLIRGTSYTGVIIGVVLLAAIAGYIIAGWYAALMVGLVFALMFAGWNVYKKLRGEQ